WIVPYSFRTFREYETKMSKRIDRVDSRAKLEPRREPYWYRLSAGRYIGFRRMTSTSEGSWLARYYDGQRYLSRPLGDFGTVAEKERFDAAKAAAEHWFAHLNLGGAVKAGTVEEACRDYLEHLRLTKSETSAQGASGYYRRLVFGDPIARIDLSKANRPHFEAWAMRLLKGGVSKASFNRALTPLRAALNHAKAIGKVATDQAWREALKPVKGAGKRRDLYLDAAERARLVEHATDETARYLNVLRLLPLRPGDVAALRVSHFDA